MISKVFPTAITASLSLFMAVTLAPRTILAQAGKTTIKNIVLVHGAWADGSSWSKVVPLLAERGFTVVAVQNPLTSLQDDVTVTKQAISRLEASHTGPVLLVAHSYGGTVITEAGSDPNVAGLVYVAAFAPEEGESTLGLAQSFPPAPALAQLSIDDYGFATLSRDGIFEDFAQDVSPREKEVLFAAQIPTALAALNAPVTSSAWRVKPAWFVVAAGDRAIAPELEQMEAKRMNAVTMIVPTSHVAMISEPNIVADFIMLAARSAGKI